MKMTRTTILTCHTGYHHLPDHAQRIIGEGMTLRDALAALRKAGRFNFGDIGGLSCELSDGSTLSVECQPCDGGRCELMSSQRIERRNHDTYTSTDKLIRVYAW